MQFVILNENIVDENIQKQVSELFKQLSPTKKQLKLDEILIRKNQVTIIGCFIKNKIVGIASMAIYRVISGSKGWIEDVVVDQNYRGMGVARNLIEELLSVSKEQKLNEVLLFTEDHRISAISLYESLGFRKKGSNIYELK